MQTKIYRIKIERRPAMKSQLNILVRWNRTSGNLEIRVPVLGNRLFCAWWLIHFCWNIGQDLAASAVRSSLYQCLNRNYDSVCTKSGYKKWFPYHRTADVKPSGIFIKWYVQEKFKIVTIFWKNFSIYVIRTSYYKENEMIYTIIVI